MIIKTERIDELKYKYKDLQRNRYLYLSLTLATISLFIVFAIRPTTVQAIEAYKNLRQLQSLEGMLREKNVQLEDANALLTKYPSEIELIKKAIPIGPNESIFLANLNESAFRNQVILDEIKFENGKDTAVPQGEKVNFKELVFTASFDSQYPDFQKFIKEVNNFLRLVEITDVSIEQNAALKGLRIKGKITGKIFYR